MINQIDLGKIGMLAVAIVLGSTGVIDWSVLIFVVLYNFELIMKRR
jgi:hypothetical protein